MKKALIAAACMAATIPSSATLAQVANQYTVTASRPAYQVHITTTIIYPDGQIPEIVLMGFKELFGVRVMRKEGDKESFYSYSIPGQPYGSIPVRERDQKGEHLAAYCTIDCFPDEGKFCISWDGDFESLADVPPLITVALESTHQTANCRCVIDTNEYCIRQLTVANNDLFSHGGRATDEFIIIMKCTGTLPAGASLPIQTRKLWHGLDETQPIKDGGDSWWNIKVPSTFPHAPLQIQSLYSAHVAAPDEPYQPAQELHRLRHHLQIFETPGAHITLRSITDESDSENESLGVRLVFQ